VHLQFKKEVKIPSRKPDLHRRKRLFACIIGETINATRASIKYLQEKIPPFAILVIISIA
jgi:hypothetical protein